MDDKTCEACKGTGQIVSKKVDQYVTWKCPYCNEAGAHYCENYQVEINGSYKPAFLSEEHLENIKLKEENEKLKSDLEKCKKAYGRLFNKNCELEGELDALEELERGKG